MIVGAAGPAVTVTGITFEVLEHHCVLPLVVVTEYEPDVVTLIAGVVALFDQV